MSRYKNTAASKLDMRIDVRNFGPISKGTIDLKPLTILIGPNNSGKSYAAMLLHSILKSKNTIANPKTAHEVHFLDQYSSLKLYFLARIKKLLAKNHARDDFSIPTSLTCSFKEGLTDSLSQYFESEITRNFGSNLDRLITTDKSLSKIRIHDSSTIDLSFTNKLLLKCAPSSNLHYKIKTAPKSTPNEKIGNTVVISIPKKYDLDLFALYVTDHVTASIHDAIMRQIPCKPYYFPASRSVLLERHRELSSDIIANVSDYKTAGKDVVMAGASADFISGILNIKESIRTPFYDLGRDLNHELLRGRISIRPSKINGIPRIRYMLNDSPLPLHKVSSMVTEIAPISLYLMHVIQPNSTLIIEEPEAHLHPENQLILAKYIVKMIRKNINIVITTHSELLLEHLGRYVLAGDLDPNKRKKAEFEPFEYLQRGEVSVHQFEKIDDTHHVIKNIDTDADVGIVQDSLLDAAREVHNKHIRLQELLGQA